MERRRGWSPQAHVLFAALLASAGEDSHGYDLSKRTGLKSGTLYPLLMRLTDQRLLAAEWRESPQPGRPRRRMYRLTPDGRAVARQLAAQHRRSAAPTKAKSAS